MEDDDRDLGAFVEMLPERAWRDAARLSDEPHGPLHGVPVGLDDPDHVDLAGERVSLLEALMPSTLLQNFGGCRR